MTCRRRRIPGLAEVTGLARVEIRRGDALVAAGSCRVRLDLNSPEFQDVFFRLELTEPKQVIASLCCLRELERPALCRHTGFQWAAIGRLKAPSGTKVPSLRVSQKIRAIAYRDGDHLRVASQHPDHDSACAR